MMFTLEMVYIYIIPREQRKWGGILESGFKIDGDTSTILDDDGAGNVRRYSLSGATMQHKVQLIIQLVKLL